MAGLRISLTIWRSCPYDATSIYEILMDWVRVMKVRHDGMGIVSLFYYHDSPGSYIPRRVLECGELVLSLYFLSVIITAIYEHLTRELFQAGR